MKPTDFDLKIIKIVKHLRILNRVGQKNIAYELKINQSTYSRIEKGETSFSHGQLKIIAILLKTNHLQIIHSAESEQ